MFYFFEVCTRTSERVLFHELATTLTEALYKLCIYRINIRPGLVKHLARHGNRFTQLEHHSAVVQSISRNWYHSFRHVLIVIVLGISYRSQAGDIVLWWVYGGAGRVLDIRVWYRNIIMTVIMTPPSSSKTTKQLIFLYKIVKFLSVIRLIRSRLPFLRARREKKDEKDEKDALETFFHHISEFFTSPVIPVVSTPIVSSIIPASVVPSPVIPVDCGFYTRCSFNHSYFYCHYCFHYFLFHLKLA